MSSGYTQSILYLKILYNFSPDKGIIIIIKRYIKLKLPFDWLRI